MSGAANSDPLITLAIMAMGGEGGGVLADWLVDLAEHNGYVAQTTSVPGVAQRTGATIYYLEMFPLAQLPEGRQPVMALSPFPGAVDMVVASELMEAGRALQRQLVHPERTTLIASLTTSQKQAFQSAPYTVESHKQCVLAHSNYSKNKKTQPSLQRMSPPAVST